MAQGCQPQPCDAAHGQGVGGVSRACGQRFVTCYIKGVVDRNENSWLDGVGVEGVDWGAAPQHCTPWHARVVVVCFTVLGGTARAHRTPAQKRAGFPGWWVHHRVGTALLVSLSFSKSNPTNTPPLICNTSKWPCSPCPWFEIQNLQVYHPCILQTKKRYVGMMYESPNQVWAGGEREVWQQ